MLDFPSEISLESVLILMEIVYLAKVVKYSKKSYVKILISYTY